MPGCIIGCYGFQRSGKTLFAAVVSERARLNGIPVYSNMDVPGWTKILSLDDIPFNRDPKVVLLDEIYFFLDSRSYVDNKDVTIFINTIGKMNVLLFYTAISPDMVEKRLREQNNYSVFARMRGVVPDYLIVDTQTGLIKTCKSGLDIFKVVKYDTQQVPDFVDMDIKGFKDRVFNFNKSNYYSKKRL